MERILEIGTQNYTKVVAIDEPEFGANHVYNVVRTNVGVDDINGAIVVDNPVLTTINFQKGPIKENGINGIHHEDLLAILLDRLNAFQATDFKCRENAIAITKLEEAGMWFNKRTADRLKRNVEGTSNL